MTSKIGVHRIVTGSNSKSAWRLDGWRRSDVPDDADAATKPMRKRDPAAIERRRKAAKRARKSRRTNLKGR